MRFVCSLLLGGITLAMLATATRADDGPALKQDVVYGRKVGMALTMDVYQPAKKNANGAAIVFVVSGGWISSREMYNTYNQAFTQEFVKRGYTVFAVFHGAQPRFTIPEAVANIHRAVHYIRRNAAQYGIDPTRIGICGASAGGHLSLMLGTGGDLGDPAAQDPVDQTSSRVQAVACLFPPTDFLNYGGKDKNAFNLDGVLAALRPAVDFHEMDPNTKRLERITDETKITQRLRDISPVTHISAWSAPTLIIHGDADNIVPLQQAEVFVTRLKAAGVPAELVVRPGQGHGWPDSTKDLDALADWFDKYLTKK